MDTVLARTATGGNARGLIYVATVFVALALVATACESTGDATTTTDQVVVTTAPAAETTAPEESPVEGFTYRVGMTTDILRPNHWAFKGPDGTIAMGYIFGPTKPAFFRIAYPGIVVAPDAAVGLPATAVQEGDVWTVTQPIRDDYTWSDGSLLTADDIVFTFETVRDTELGGTWPAAYPYREGSSPRLLDVEALDAHTVMYTFDAKPGAATWPHQVGVAPIMPKKPWQPVVAEALESADPAAVLYGSDALEVGDLSGGPLIYNGHEEGKWIESIRNPHYANEGFTHQFWDDGSYALNGELLYGEGVGDPVVDYTEGPYLDRTLVSIYKGDPTAAMLALVNGEIDYWMDPSGPNPGLRREGLEADGLTVTLNPNNGFLYLGLNLRTSPGKFPGFRQAMAYFDKESLTSNVLQGAVSPLYVMMPEGNAAWYDSEVADEIASRYKGLSTNERVAAAYAALVADGFRWETAAVFDDEGNLVTPGVGMIDPEGTPVPELELLAQSADLRPQPHATSLWLEDWAESLGMPVEASPSDTDTIIASVWPGVGTEPTFDMYILVWGLGSPAWPTFHEAFFHTRNLAETNDGANATGYSNPEFDALADAMYTETDQKIAFDQVWEMERMIADDLPYMVLFSGPITEFFRSDLEYPFTHTLSGIQLLAGMPATVSQGGSAGP